ncbi:hypothetical protein D3C71_1830400 [compost metagenome]
MEREWLSWTNATLTPVCCENSRALNASKKKPRLSANTFGSMISTSGIAVGMMFIAARWPVVQVLTLVGLAGNFRA